VKACLQSENFATWKNLLSSLPVDKWLTLFQIWFMNIYLLSSHEFIILFYMLFPVWLFHAKARMPSVLSSQVLITLTWILHEESLLKMILWRQVCADLIHTGPAEDTIVHPVPSWNITKIHCLFTDYSLWNAAYEIHIGFCGTKLYISRSNFTKYLQITHLLNGCLNFSAPRRCTYLMSLLFWMRSLVNWGKHVHIFFGFPSSLLYIVQP
jgi:hypothetical protein